MQTPQPGKWVCLSYDVKKTQDASKVANKLNGTPIPAADLRQRENYTWKRRTEASQKKGLSEKRPSSCVTAPVTVGDPLGHPCGNF